MKWCHLGISLLLAAVSFADDPTSRVLADAQCSVIPCRYLPVVFDEPKVRVTDWGIAYLGRSNNSLVVGDVTNFSARTATNMLVTADLYRVDAIGNRDFITTVRGTTVFTYLLSGQTTPFQIPVGDPPGPTYTATVRMQATLITLTPSISPSVIYTPVVDIFGAAKVDLYIRNTYSETLKQLKITVWSKEQDCDIYLKSYDAELLPGKAFTDTWYIGEPICPRLNFVPPDTIRVAAQATK